MPLPSDSSRRLGRGLDALLATRDAINPTPARTTVSSDTTTPDPSTTSAISAAGTASSVPVARIEPNPFQPRTEFREQDLADLTASIKANGLLQPVTLRPHPSGTGYQLIAGERRLRAAVRLGWSEIPALVREVDDQTLLTLAIVENLQRADLNPLDEAEGYERLAKSYTLTQQQVADLVGKDRSTVANALRLLGLPETVKTMVRRGTLSAGHGRALLTAGVPSRITALATEAAEHDWSVRETERRARTPAAATSTPATSTTAAPRPAAAPSGTATTRRIEQLLRQKLQTDATLHLAGRDRGEIRIAFTNADDLDRLLAALGIRIDD
jgi:ParB family transcriptional regulator, chromosome partitioning protein